MTEKRARTAVRALGLAAVLSLALLAGPVAAAEPYGESGAYGYGEGGAYGEGGTYGEEGTYGEGEGAGSAPAGREVKLRIVRVDGKRILGDSRGHTLYSLSAERRGKFVCTRSSGCLGLWKPLLIPAHGKVEAPVKLGSIERPEGGKQVTYRGRPLYAFALDRKPGTTKGEGIKDVGTWHAVQVPRHR
jgi:predicted lipoprotein with Yx(FWY)xxD motif